MKSTEKEQLSELLNRATAESLVKIIEAVVASELVREHKFLGIELLVKLELHGNFR